MFDVECNQRTLVRTTLLNGVALSAAGLEQTSTLLGVTFLETHYAKCSELGKYTPEELLHYVAYGFLSGIFRFPANSL